MENIYVHQAITSLNTQSNPVLINFFNDKNMSLIQSSLKIQVKKKIGQSISNQSCNEIYTIMKYIYVNNAKIIFTKFHEEVLRLNSLVLNELVPMVVSNVLQYIQYISDINTLPTPINRGVTTTTKGDNSLELRTF
jgi:hypothetical protein